MKKLLAISALSCLVLAACSDKSSDIDFKKQLGPNPELAEPSNFLLPPMKVPEHASWGDKKPQAAQGLQVEAIAKDLKHPRMVYTLPNGDILVVESNGPGQEFNNTPKQFLSGKVKGRSGKSGDGGNSITLLRNEGGSWKKYPFLDGLKSPFGIQLIGDNLYVANTTNLMRYHYNEGDTKITDPGTELADLPNQINHHWTKSLRANPEGTKLYVGAGSNSNIGEDGMGIEYRRAVILEVDVESGASKVYASGIRNATGMDFEPETNQLWAISNERDEIGGNIVPDYLTSVNDGDFFGWPWSFWGQHIDKRALPTNEEMVKKARKPDYALGSHIAALGIHFYRGEALPEKYRHGVFISEHGSWNRSPLSGYEVVFVPFENGKPKGMPETVLKGFVSADESEAYGAPVGITEDQDGNLIIADDVGNTVWKVSAAQ